MKTCPTPHPNSNRDPYPKFKVAAATRLSERPAVQRRRALLERLQGGEGERARDPHRIALVMIEFQNEFTTENGKMHDAVKASMEKTGMLANAAAVCRVAREKGCTVIHAPITAAADGSVSFFFYAV